MPAAVRLLGKSGSGKSALLGAGSDAANSREWLCVEAHCHEIQAKLPLAGAQRLAQSILHSLGPEKERYAAETLELALGNSRQGFDEAFLQLVDGVSLDFPLLLTIDDVQWLDPESRALIEHTLRAYSSRPIGLLVAERPVAGQMPQAWLDSGLNVRLERLPEAAAAEVVRIHYPGAREAVVNAIVSQAMAHPIDLVTLALAAKDNLVNDPSELIASVRTVLARQLDAMVPAQREFLQVCALVSEPISYRILAKIWPEERGLMEQIEHASGRYLIQDGDALRFAHVTIADSIRQTMPIEIPYRRRILAALTAIEQPSLNDYAAAVSQASACGDVDLEYQYLLKLADEADALQAFLTASDAYERALLIRPPSSAELISFYRKYAMSLDCQGRFAEAAVVLRRALHEATIQGLSNSIGTLGALLIASVASSEGVQAAAEIYEYYLAQATNERERALLHSIGSYWYVCRGDVARFQETKDEVLQAKDTPPEASVRLFLCESLLHSRMGDYPQARRSLERAKLLADGISASHRMTTEYSRGLVEFFQFGTNAPAKDARREQGGDPLDPVRVMALLSVGDWDDARAFITSAIAAGRQTLGRPQILAADAAIAVLSRVPASHALDICEELRNFQQGAVNDAVVPLAAWWTAAVATESREKAATLLGHVQKAVAEPLAPFTLFVPLSIVIAAHRLGDRNLLEQYAEMRGIWCDRNPWNLAHRDLAMGLAQALLGRSKDVTLLETAAQAFDQLGAPFFAAYARASAGRNAERSLELLTALGVTELPTATPATAKKVASGAGIVGRPTARERQVAALVASGNSNREIAEQLVLSERTVEAHLSNLFNKIGVSSRTQLAAWYYSA